MSEPSSVWRSSCEKSSSSAGFGVLGVLDEDADEEAEAAASWLRRRKFTLASDTIRMGSALVETVF